MKQLKLFTLFALLTTQAAFAHGDNKLGPNGGYLKMPSNFHTELVPVTDKTFNVFLTDIGFKNPMVANSKVEMLFVKDNGKIAFNCTAGNQNFFTCSSKESVPQKGQIIIKATRSGTVGADAIYEYPLKLKGEKVETKVEAADPHAGHH